MTLQLRFLPEVENDILAGFAWYEEKSPGLGEEFLRMVLACTHNIAHHPLSYPKVHGEFRRCLLRRFPWSIYYLVEGNTITAFGLFHCARNPQTLTTLLLERDKGIN